MNVDARRWEWVSQPIRKLKPLSGGIAEPGQSDQVHVLPANRTGLPEGTVNRGNGGGQVPLDQALLQQEPQERASTPPDISAS